MSNQGDLLFIYCFQCPICHDCSKNNKTNVFLQKLAFCKICYSLYVFLFFFFCFYFCFLFLFLFLFLFVLFCFFGSFFFIFALLFFFFFAFFFSESLIPLFYVVINFVQYFSRSTNHTSVQHVLYSCPSMTIMSFILPFQGQSQKLKSSYGKSKMSKEPLFFFNSRSA
jgi:hypothetical protein